MYYCRLNSYCRWCGTPYKPGKAVDRDGFCCDKCKAALYRARKKYVTDVASRENQLEKIGYDGRKKTKKKG